MGEVQSKKDDLIECCDEIMIFYMNHCDEDKDQGVPQDIYDRGQDRWRPEGRTLTT